MTDKEMATLKKGDVIMYIGPEHNVARLERGELYIVVATGKRGFKIEINERGDRFTVFIDRTREYGIGAYVKFPSHQGDKTNLTLADYATVIDFALDIKDLKWARRLHARAKRLDAK